LTRKQLRSLGITSTVTEQRASAQAGFTLTELLVVIAIIVLMAATQVPALSRAKPKSQTARCASNMRIWAMATAMYQADNTDHLPYFALSSSDYTQPYWESLLAPYMARVAQSGGSFQPQPRVLFSQTEIITSEVRKCPGGSSGAPDFWQGASLPLLGGWNCWIGANFGVSANPITGPFYYGDFASRLNPPLSVSRIKKPANALIFMDTITHYVYSPVEPGYKFTQDMNGDGKLDSMTSSSAAFNWGRPTVHSGGANVTLMDGHVERVTFEKLWQVDGAGNVVHSFWYMED
jgi:prepilin-type N-terminal cleavage/methylation domain-containing protein/prepilin-type processing-associated H-X9-DG protein